MAANKKARTAICSVIVLMLLFMAISNKATAQNMSVTIQSQNVHCFGGNDGSAQANPSGGNPPYTFHWTNAAGADLGTNPMIDQLTAGTYTVTVQDAAGSALIKSVTITSPPQLGATAYAQSQICLIAPDGTAISVPYGGTTPYTYLWSNGGATAMITGLASGVYTATITDGNSCTVTANANVIFFANEGIWTSLTSQNAACPSANNGYISIMPMSGTPPYQYLWSTGETTAEISNLPGGLYKLTITDSNGCVGNTQESIVLDTTSLNTATTLANALCQQTPETFFAFDSLFYDQYIWQSSNTNDIISHFPGEAHATFSWSSLGPRTITVQQSHTGTPCKTTSSWTFSVKTCINGTSDLLPEKYQVSPNPFSGTIDIALENTENRLVVFELKDMMGRIVLTGQWNGTQHRLDTSMLPPGPYFLQIKGDRSTVFKLMK